MRILTTTLCYPTRQHPDQGVFVQRRSAAVAALPGVELSVVAPQLWCPVLRCSAAPDNAGRGTSFDCGAGGDRGPAHLRSELVSRREIALRVPSVTYPRMLSVPVLGWATDGLAYGRTLCTVLRGEIAAGRRPDLIDAHFEYPDAVGAWLAGRRFGIPVCVTIRGKIVSLSRRALRRAQITAMLRGVQARIAVSSSLAEWARRLAGSDLEVDVIPNGVDPAVYYRISRQHARAALGWDSAAHHVLAVGHFQRLKGFDRILEIVPGVRAACGDVRFVFVGSRRGERSFQKELSRLAGACNTGRTTTHRPSFGWGGDSAVTFLDPVSADRLNLMYNAADLLVSASRSEGWCNAIAEALATGTPVVATDVGGNGEQLCRPELGRLVPDGEQAALARATITALCHPWDRNRIRELGGVRTWSNVAREVHGVFTRTLKTWSQLTRHRTKATGYFEEPACPCEFLMTPDVVTPPAEVLCGTTGGSRLAGHAGVSS